jgi:hypothetical protein
MVTTALTLLIREVLLPAILSNSRSRLHCGSLMLGIREVGLVKTMSGSDQVKVKAAPNDC